MPVFGKLRHFLSAHKHNIQIMSDREKFGKSRNEDSGPVTLIGVLRGSP